MFEINLQYHFKDPLQLDGKGDYALTDVLEMNGTEEFLNLAVEVKKCQIEESVLECSSRKYLKIGKNKCECIPHHLRTFYRTVRYCQNPSLTSTYLPVNLN